MFFPYSANFWICLWRRDCWTPDCHLLSSLWLVLYVCTSLGEGREPVVNTVQPPVHSEKLRGFRCTLILPYTTDWGLKPIFSLEAEKFLIYSLKIFHCPSSDNWVILPITSNNNSRSINVHLVYHSALIDTLQLTHILEGTDSGDNDHLWPVWPLQNIFWYLQCNGGMTTT